MARILAPFLPGGSNPHLSFPLAAAKASVARFWVDDNTRPIAVTYLLEATFAAERHRFCPLIETVVRMGIAWRRGRGDPLRREELDRVNDALLRLGYKIPELHGEALLAELDQAAATVAPRFRPRQLLRRLFASSQRHL